MLLEVPVFIYKVSQAFPRAMMRCGPLFPFPYAAEAVQAPNGLRPVVEDQNPERALARVKAYLRWRLNHELTQPDHRPMLPLLDAPALQSHKVEVRLALKARSYHFNLLVVTFKRFGGRMGYVPILPELLFQLPSGAKLDEHVSSVLEAYIGACVREERLEQLRLLETLDLSRGRGIEGGRVEYLELNLDVKQQLPKPSSNLAQLFGPQTFDGQDELYKVGTPLHERAREPGHPYVGREPELEQLRTLLEGSERASVLLVGKPGVGRTSLLLEHLRRQQQRGSGQMQSVYHLSPGRLIAGMSVVGAWEGRLMAILRHAAKRQLILYFDELVSLFRTGQSASSRLNMAVVLKAWIERRAVRVVGEVTEEELARLQELDRSFVELFEHLRLHEPTERQLYMILMRRRVDLEYRHHVHISPDELTELIRLTRRVEPTLAFPGKALRLLERVTQYHGAQVPSMQQLLIESWGLARLHLLQDDPLISDYMDDILTHAVVGQRDVITWLQTRCAVITQKLTDPERPLAVLLFTGPTGVGKTELAKALAKRLYGDPDALLRLDMNQLVSPYSVARLVGTLDAPAGLLTQPVLSQPFRLILLDEIEKAHPDVFTLLLQVMGEGRLTDALGRVANFTQTVLVMTSNLGVAETGRTSGFGPPQQQASVWQQAVERFFAPEFVNRIDKILPFHRLELADLHQILARIIRQAQSEAGFQSMHTTLEVLPQAAEILLQLSLQDGMGARALKRVVRREVLERVAEQAAAEPEEQDIRMVFGAIKRELTLHFQKILSEPELAMVQLGGEALSPAQLRRLHDWVAELRALQHQSSLGSVFNLENMTPQRERALALATQLTLLESRLEQLAEAESKPRPPIVRAPLNARVSEPPRHTWAGMVRRGVPALESVLDLRAYLEQQLTANPGPLAKSPGQSFLQSLFQELFRLEQLLQPLQPELAGYLLFPWSMNTEKQRDNYEWEAVFVCHRRQLMPPDVAAPGNCVGCIWMDADAGAKVLDEQGFEQILAQEGDSELHELVALHVLPIPRALLAAQPPDFELFELGRTLMQPRIQAFETWTQALARGDASWEHDPYSSWPLKRVWLLDLGVYELAIGKAYAIRQLNELCWLRWFSQSPILQELDALGRADGASTSPRVTDASASHADPDPESEKELR